MIDRLCFVIVAFPGHHVPASGAQSDARSTGGQKVAGLIPAGSGNIRS